MVGLKETTLRSSVQELSLPQTDPIVLELNRLHDQLKEKDRELGMAQNEIKAMKAADVLKEKAVEELENELIKLDEKLRLCESLLDQKNLDIKKLTNEKKEALAAQYAAESTLRRVHASQKDDDSIPIESIIAPLDAEIKKYKNEVASLQEDKKALDRLNKSKEAALLEAERILRSALERALIVEEVQNQNFELRRQIEICQDELTILEKTNRQKILEVEMLSQTIKELEEAILAGGAAANDIHDYQRQISELQEEKRTMERELSRVKVSANRVATVVANEWKDESGKVMPVKQWLEERRLLQAEMQRLRDKLTISERTAKVEAQLKDKMKMRLKTLEEGLKHGSSTFSNKSNAFCGSSNPGNSNNLFRILSSNSRLRKRSTSQPRGSIISRSSYQKPDARNEASNGGDLKMARANSFRTKYTSGDNLLIRKSLWASRSKVVDDCDEKENPTSTDDDKLKENATTHNEGRLENIDYSQSVSDDIVSGFLYDQLQKEVINLRKSCEARESALNAKDEEIKMLIKKVETLTKSFEVEAKKMKREAAIREKDSTSVKAEDKKKHKNNANSS